MRLHESRAKRFDVLELQAQAKGESWQEDRSHVLAYRVPHTDVVVSVRVALSFTAERLGGRRVWWTCPGCKRRVRFLFGGRPHISKPHGIACAKCQRIAYASNLESQGRRWRRQIAKIESRLGGDPRTLQPPKGLARRTFHRLARRHAAYRAVITAQAEERLRGKLRNRLWPTDPAELRAMREAYGLSIVAPADNSTALKPVQIACLPVRIALAILKKC